MKAAARLAHVALSPLLPILLAGSLFLPTNPPPIGHMVRDAALLYLVVGLWLATAWRRSAALPGRAAAATVVITLTLAYPLLARMAGLTARSTPDRIAAVVFTLCVLAIARSIVTMSARETAELGGTLSAVIVVMIAVVWFWGWQAYVTKPTGPWKTAVATLTAPPAVAPSRPDDPDIVHVILDGLGRRDVLATKYGIDVTPEIHGLEGLGLRVQDSAVANYSQTFLSLAAMLNMAHLPPLAATLGDSPYRRPLQAAINQSAVITALKTRGYRFEFLGSSYDAGRDHALADVCDCDAMPIGEFESALIDTSPARVLPTPRFLYAAHRDEVRAEFDRLANLPASDRPRIVIAHFLVPHPPFVIGPDGDLPDPAHPYQLLDGSQFEVSREAYRAGYGQQTLYALRETIAAFQALSRHARRPIVFVVQGDHGPGLDYDPGSLARTDTSERMTLFLAVSWRAGDAGPGPGSPVNLYRDVFDRYFGTHLGFVEDQSYFSTFEQPYRLELVSVR